MTTGSTARLFVTLWPDEAVRDELARQRDVWRWPRSATPVKTDQLHLTLHFLGDVESDLIPELSDALAVPFSPFALELGRPVQWPHGIAVLEPLSASVALLHMHARLGKALAGMGIECDERPYRPHVTLARRAGDVTAPAQAAPFTWHVGGYRLMVSVPGTGYVTLRDYPGS